MKSPLISIIVPCYNVEEYIDISLGNILYQTYSNWECIAINDGSKDGTENKINHWVKKDQRFRLISQENSGAASARNKGLKVATGDCILFFDSDDLLDQNCLKILISQFDQTIDIVIGKSAMVIGQTKEIIGTLEHYSVTDKVLNNIDLIELALNSPFSVVPWNKLFNSKFLASNNLTFKDGVKHEDELWFFETMHLAKKIIFNSNITYYYNVGNQDSVMKNYNLKSFKSYLSMAEHIFNNYYVTEQNMHTKRMVGTYILNFQLVVISGFFRFLKKNKVSYKSEGVSLIKKHIQNNPINDFSHLNSEKSKQYTLFIKYVKLDPETAFKLVRNTNKRNLLKFIENIYLKLRLRNALKNSKNPNLSTQ